MKKQIFIFFILFCVISSCNYIECRTAKVDSIIKELEEYNSNFFDSNYTGTLIDYHNDTDSIIKHKLFYENGKIYQYESYHEDGTPKIIKSIKCQTTHGKMVYYLPNYKLAYDLEYHLGKKEGIGHSYFENGLVQKIVNYKNDLKEGRQLELSEKEDTIVVEVYEKGNLISKLEPFVEMRKLADEMNKSNVNKDSLLSEYVQYFRYFKNNIPSKELQEKLDNAMTVEEHQAKEALKENNQ